MEDEFVEQKLLVGKAKSNNKIITKVPIKKVAYSCAKDGSLVVEIKKKADSPSAINKKVGLKSKNVVTSKLEVNLDDDSLDESGNAEQACIKSPPKSTRMINTPMKTKTSPKPFNPETSKTAQKSLPSLADDSSDVSSVVSSAADSQQKLSDFDSPAASVAKSSVTKSVFGSPAANNLGDVWKKISAAKPSLKKLSQQIKKRQIIEEDDSEESSEPVSVTKQKIATPTIAEKIKSVTSKSPKTQKASQKSLAYEDTATSVSTEQTVYIKKPKKRKRKVDTHQMIAHVNYNRPKFHRMTKSEKSMWENQLNVALTNMAVLYPELEIDPRKSALLPLGERFDLYYTNLSNIHSSNKASEYELYLLLFWAVLEAVFVHVLKLPMEGYTKIQFAQSRKYKMLLIQVGAQNFSIIEAQSSPFKQIIVSSIITAAVLIIVNLILNKVVQSDVIRNKLKENITPMLSYMADPVKAPAAGVNLPGAAGPNESVSSIKGCVEQVMGLFGMISGNDSSNSTKNESAAPAKTAEPETSVNEGALFDE